MLRKLLKKSIYAITLLLAVTVLASPVHGQLEQMIYNDIPYSIERVDFQVVPETKANTADKKSVKQPQPTVEHYRVETGDTLWGLASQFGISIDKLAALNGLSAESQLFVGQVIDLPGTNIKHTVKAGETLSGICNQYDTTLSQLLKANNISDPNLVKIGQTLKIPAEESAPVQAAATSTQNNLPVLAMNLPVQGRISSEFGIRGEEGRPHEGIDIAANQGELINAPCSGQIVFSGPYGTYGNTVIIDHGDNMRSLYAHCSTLLVQNGQQVQKGDPIAKVGNTGRSTGPHLHWEVTYKGIAFDPMFCIQANDI